jgi:hypothetical protein
MALDDGFLRYVDLPSFSFEEKLRKSKLADWRRKILIMAENRYSVCDTDGLDPELSRLVLATKEKHREFYICRARLIRALDKMEPKENQ